MACIGEPPFFLGHKKSALRGEVRQNYICILQLIRKITTTSKVFLIIIAKLFDFLHFSGYDLHAEYYWRWLK